MQQHRKRQAKAILTCFQKNHQQFMITSVCLEEGCMNNFLFCSKCQQEHKGHRCITLGAIGKIAFENLTLQNNVYKLQKQLQTLEDCHVELDQYFQKFEKNLFDEIRRTSAALKSFYESDYNFIMNLILQENQLLEIAADLQKTSESTKKPGFFDIQDIEDILSRALPTQDQKSVTLMPISDLNQKIVKRIITQNSSLQGSAVVEMEQIFNDIKNYFASSLQFISTTQKINTANNSNLQSFDSQISIIEYANNQNNDEDNKGNNVPENDGRTKLVPSQKMAESFASQNNNNQPVIKQNFTINNNGSFAVPLQHHDESVFQVNNQNFNTITVQPGQFETMGMGNVIPEEHNVKPSSSENQIFTFEEKEHPGIHKKQGSAYFLAEQIPKNVLLNSSTPIKNEQPSQQGEDLSKKQTFGNDNDQSKQSPNAPKIHEQYANLTGKNNGIFFHGQDNPLHNISPEPKPTYSSSSPYDAKELGINIKTPVSPFKQSIIPISASSTFQPNIESRSNRNPTTSSRDIPTQPNLIDVHHQYFDQHYQPTSKQSPEKQIYSQGQQYSPLKISKAQSIEEENQQYIAPNHGSYLRESPSQIPQQVSQIVSHGRVVWKAHEGVVRDIVFVDSDQIASCGSDALIKIWSKDDFQLLQQLEGHSKDVTVLTYLNSTRTLISGSEDQTIRVWRTAPSWMNVYTLKGHRGTIRTLFFYDQRTLVSGGMDGAIQVWDMERAQILDEIDTGESQVSSLLCLREVFLLAACGRFLCTFDARNWNKIKKLEAHKNEIQQIALEKKSQQTTDDQALLLFTCDSQGTLKIWDSFDLILLAEIQEQMPITSIVYLPDNKDVILGLANHVREGKISIWNIEHKKQVLEYVENTSAVNQILLDFEKGIIFSCHQNKCIERNILNLKN